MTFTKRVVAGALGTGALASAVLFGALPTATAEPLPPPPPPPNCTAADLEGVRAGVAAATSAYLFTRPDVNGFFTSLDGLPTEERRDDVLDYLEANPAIQSELYNLRRPLVDIRMRCGVIVDVP